MGLSFFVYNKHYSKHPFDFQGSLGKFYFLVSKLNKNLQDTLPASSERSHFDSAGWYKVATFEAIDAVSTKGSTCNSVNISIKRDFHNANNEYYNILLMSIYCKSQFVLIGKLINTRGITKIRHTVDIANLKAYLEIYYSLSSSNDVQINLYDTNDTAGNKWTAITPIATEETVDGVSVVSSMDLTTT